MLPLLIGWAVMAAAIIRLATLPTGRPALLYWALLSLGTCLLGGLALRSQPLGEATLPGRLGYAVVRWGFRATQGRLPGAVAISWMVWLMTGAAIITAVRARGDLLYQLMLLAWVVDALALMYVLGVWLSGHGGRVSGNPTLLVISAVLAAMIGSSAALWWMIGTPAARKGALLLAGGPTLAVGGGYALFLLVTLTVGRNARWN